MALYTADWSPLGRDVYYRKFELYSMKWQEQGLNLSEFIVAAAPYGGPIAIIRDEKKIMKIKLSSVCLIHLFSASGQTLGNIRHDSGIIVAMGWSNTESLVCVQKDGVIIEYNLLGKILETFTMGQVPKDTNVLDCKIFTTSQRTGVGVLTGSYSFFLVESISSHKTWQLPEVPGMVAPPSSWTIIADEQGTRVVVAKDDKIFVLDPRGSARCIEETPPITTMFKAVTEMAVSFDYRNIALFLDDGHLWIGTSDLRSTLCELDTKEKSRPKQLLWCGQKAVVGHWGKILLVLGFERDFINYPVDVPIHLVQEVDGVRLIGNTIHELLQKVPNVVKDVFRIGSMDPGALLLAASVEFEVLSQGSPVQAQHRTKNDCDRNSLSVAVLILVVVMVVASAIFSLTKPQRGGQHNRINRCKDDICLHPIWLTSNLNQSVDPCDDFSGYVCSAWKPTLQDIARTIGHFPKYTWMKNKAKYLAGKSFSTEWMKYVAQVYKSCIDRTGENQSETLAEFTSFLNKRVLRRPDDINEVSPLDVALDLSIRWQIPFWFDVQLLAETSSKRRRIYFSPSRHTFWKSTYNEFTDKWKYQKLLEDFRRIFLYHNVANANYSEADFRVAADIIGSIYNASFRKQKRPAILSFHDLEGLLPAGKGNNWTGLLNKNFRPSPPFSGRDIILVSDTEILEVLKRLLRTHGWTHVLNQLAWWFVQAYAVVASDDAFVVKYGGKASANAMKPLFCEIEVEEAYTLPLLVDHVSSNYNSSDRTAINVLLESVIMAAITKIGECDWMDNRSRKAAVDKLRQIFINLWPREDIYAEFFPPSAERQKQKSYVRYWIRDHELSVSEIGAAVYYEKNRMAHNFRDETFEYDYLLNNVSLPMLALEDLFYDRRGSVAFNYGALGSVFARKVVMSFDPQGINHLPNGTLHSWLSKDSKATFMQKATCGVEDFQPNIFPEIPGLEVTFRAFQDASQSSRRSSEDHPSVEDKKMFFLAFCHVMCILDVKEIGERCNVVLKHFRPFAETFECPLGSWMNPTHKCRFF